MNSIKENIKYIFGLILAIMTGAFFYERSRRKSAEAIADNKELIDTLNQLETKKVSNDGQLKSEEIKRQQIAKDTEQKKNDSSNDDLSSYFNKRNNTK